jgi:hypothetical protein
MPKAVDTIKDVGKSIDPTTEEGLLNIATGGLYGLQKDKVSDAYDDISGKDMRDDMQDALANQAQAQADQTAFAREQWEQYQQQLDPYIKAGESFLPQFTEFLSPESQAQFKSEYLAGPEYQNLQAQATEQQLQNAAAFGGLRSSGTQDRIIRETATLADQLSNQAYQGQLNNYMQGVNIGSGALGNKLSSTNAYNQQAQQGIAAQGDLALQSASLNQGTLQSLLPLIQTGASIYGAA